MELNVTHMVEDADQMFELSGSCMEHGQNAGQITWGNSVAYGKEHPLLTTDEACDAARAHFKEYSAWTKVEIAAWPENKLQGIMCQEVAAAIREMETAENSGRVYQGDDGQWYFYLGS